MTSEENIMKVEYFCPECGGTNVRSLYWLEWNIEKQEWELGSFSDVESFMEFCDDCDEEIKRLGEREIKSKTVIRKDRK